MDYAIISDLKIGHRNAITSNRGGFARYLYNVAMLNLKINHIQPWLAAN